jgi:hypothetical protein
MSATVLVERPLLAYSVEKVGSRVARKRKIGNSTVQNGRHCTNASQLGLSTVTPMISKFQSNFIKKFLSSQCERLSWNDYSDAQRPQ